MLPGLLAALLRESFTVSAAHAGDVFHQLLAGFDVVLRRDGNLLHDRRAAAVVVADVGDAAGSGAQPVSQVSPELRLIFGRHVGIALGVLKQRFAGGRIGKILLMREGRRDAAGDVAENFGLAEDRFAGQTTADVAVDGMRNIGAGSVRNKSYSGDVNFGLAQVG